MTKIQLRFGSGRGAWLLAPLVATLVGIVGCKKDETTPGPSAAPPKEVRLGYFANFTHAQAVLGVHTGEFEKAVAPAKFSTKVFNAGPSLIEALFAGEIDIGYIGPGPALNGYAKSKGQKVRVVAGAAANGVLLVARPDSGITKLTDLTGKTLLTPQFGNTQDIAAKHYLKEALPASDFTKVKVNPVPNAEHASLMLRKEADAAWVPEPWGSLLVQQAKATVVAEERTLWPEGSFATTVVITTPEFMQKHADVLEKVLGVHAGWTAKLKADPQAVLPTLEDGLFKLTNKKMPPGVLASAVKTTQFTDDPQAHTFAKFAKWAYELDFAKEQTDPSGLIDTAILTRVRGGTTTTGPATAPK